ncbi:MAG TPA: M23 family metallopeptidase, partial [Fodinibius sp.]|nr:M23 family metallopeptidase [Fodinibius sp.]
LGLVGNTGNARTTPPHLHFGIYGNGAVNPLPFIDDPRVALADLNVDTSLIGKWGRVQNAKANIRPLPSTQEPPVTSLSQNEAVRILGAVESWYQVELPDTRRGFVYSSLLEPADEPLRIISGAAGDSLFENYSTQYPLLVTSSPETLPTFASYGDKQLVQYRNRLVWRRGSQINP